MRYFAPDIVGKYAYFAPDDAPAALTKVSVDLPGAYVVRTSALADLAAAYAVRASTSTSLSASYSVRGQVSSDLLASYAISNASKTSVSADLSGAYGVRAAVAAGLDGTYSVRAAVVRDGVFAYSINSSSTAQPASGSTSINISQISPAHVAVFDGSGSRIAVFGGTGARTTINGMTMKLPTVSNGKMMCDRDPDEISWYGADITQELADRATAPDASKLALDLSGVAVVQAAAIQTATVGGVTRTYVVVLLGGVDGTLPADWRWTARVTCANGERFDKTTFFNRVDT